jgi:hypothetical protein
MSLVSAGHWQVEVSATDESLSQSNPTECARALAYVLLSVIRRNYILLHLQ